jgi:SAM-dependent methyltransferase
MSSLPAIHLCLVQPVGYVHSLGLLDPARYFRHQFRRFGATVTMAKNRLRHDAVNFVFGAHLGFDATLTARHACIFVNLEQLGDGGAAVAPAYLQLLSRAAVVDYDAANVAAYCDTPEDVPLVSILHAPYLAPAAAIPLEQRPIDLLFIGSLNERRRALIDRIEAAGVSVSLFDQALYGDERDAFIGQAKAVFNAHFYESSRFEQVRVAHCLSLGTPVIAERAPSTRAPAAFDEAVHWVGTDDALEDWFATRFGMPEFFEASRAQLARFAASDPMEDYAEVLAFAAGFGREHHQRRDPAPWRPAAINLGSGKDYRAGWLNLDVIAQAQPDLLLDLGRPLALPLAARCETQGELLLAEDSVDLINANNVLEHVPDLPTLMGNCLRLLRSGGQMQIEVPYERAPTAWQDPTHLRAMNENSWLYYCDWFWYLGWFEHRFEIAASSWLDTGLQPSGQDQAAFMRVTLRKRQTTPQERMLARTYQPDLRLPDDEAWPVAAPQPAARVPETA